MKLGVVLACSLALTGCVLSTDAVVRESEATFDARLLGNWKDVSASDRAVISRTGLNGYAIKYTSNDEIVLLEGRLGRLGDRVVMDVWATPREADLPAPYRDLLVPGHLLLALEIGANEVRLATLEHDSLRAAYSAGEARLAHTLFRDQPILLGTTEQFRGALAAHLARDGSLSKPEVWRRVQDAPPAAVAPVEVPCFDVSVWREADLLFRRDPHWVGADGAYSIDLGNARSLWLFGDTWIDPSGGHTRQGAHMIRNSVAIQTGADPSKAKIEFYWGKTTDGRAGAFFPEQGSQWFWPGHGVRLGDRLVLFLNRVRGTGTGIGFESAGWNSVMVNNPDEEPSQWRVTWLDTPPNALGVIVGFASVIRWGEHVYAFGSQDPVKSHPIYVVRWPVEEVRRGNLLAPEWWAGRDAGWVADSSPLARWPVFENGQSELTVHYDDIARRFLAVHTVGFGSADVAIRASAELTGPWTEPRMIHRPAEFYQPNIMIYAAKAHPQLAGAVLVLTYATNSFRFSDHLTDSLIYYPRFLRLAHCK